MDGVFSTYGREAHRVLVGIPEGKRPIGRTRLRWEGNVNIDLKGIVHVDWDRLCGLVVRVSGYRYRGLGFDSRRYQIF